MEYLPDEDAHTLRSPTNQLLEYWVVTMGGKGTARKAIDWIDLVDYGDQCQALVNTPVGLIFYKLLYIAQLHINATVRLGIMNRLWFM
jgi:hypothetical protein